MKNFFTSIFLVLVLLAMTAGTAFAQETTPITGTVESVVLETDALTGETTIVVTLLDETTDTLQTVKLSLETAESLGLVVTDPTTGESKVTEDAVGTTVEIDPATVLLEEETEEDQHPVGSALSDFFSGLLGVDYETIMTYHEDGVGFGVIAQALWLTNNIGGDTAAFEALLEAKQSGDYNAVTLADGTTPDNWGDVVKSLKKEDNLGSVASGKGESAGDTSEVITEAKGLGNSNNGNDDGNSNSNGYGNGNDKDNGKDNGKGGGRP